MRSRITAVAVAASLVTLASCARPDAPVAAASSSASVDELGRTSRDWSIAVNAQDAAKAASFYATDAVLYPPGQAQVRGRVAIEAYWKAAIDQDALHDVRVETIEARSASDLGYEVGLFAITVNGPAGKPLTQRGRYTQILRREPNGAWVVASSMWNAEPAPPTQQ